MKILFVNSVCGIGSTGRICTDLAQEYYEKNYEKKMSKLRKVLFINSVCGIGSTGLAWL